MAPVEASRAEPDFGTLSQPGPAMMAELAAVNLQRLFWLLIVGLGTRLVSLVANHFSAASSDVLAAMQWFDLVAIPPLIVLTWRLRRPGASVRLAWMLILFVMWGTLGMAVIQALISAADLGYRAIYVFGVMIVGIAYVLPPRVILPAFALTHFAYLGLVTTGDYDALQAGVGERRLAGRGVRGRGFVAVVSGEVDRAGARAHDRTAESSVGGSQRGDGRFDGHRGP